jgi:hypothetical protein
VVKNIGISSVAANVLIQLALAGSMSQIWTMENHLNYIFTLHLINIPFPGNV